MATRTRPEPLSAEQREVVRDAARYADTWVALRARTQRDPGRPGRRRGRGRRAALVRARVREAAGDERERRPGRAADDRGTCSASPPTPRRSRRRPSCNSSRRASCGSTTPSDEHVAALAGVADRRPHRGRAAGSRRWGRARQPRGRLLAAAAGVPRRRGAGRGLPRRADVLERNERFKYSNIGYGVLGLVIEAVSGQSYADYVVENVVDRLGLRNTGPELDTNPVGRVRRRLLGPRGVRPAVADRSGRHAGARVCDRLLVDRRGSLPVRGRSRARRRAAAQRREQAAHAARRVGGRGEPRSGTGSGSASTRSASAG